MKDVCQVKKHFIFANAFSNALFFNRAGPVVQLVRIHACHAWGREFESRPDRQLQTLII